MVDSVIGNRYRLAEKIGSGGMADVYKAHDEVLGRSVAVKIMHAKYAADPSFAQRFRQEAQAAANLQSPYIVNIYDWGEEGNTYFIAMEYVRGTDLKSVIQERGWLPSAEVANIGAQVCSALAIAHGYDIIHRDIKPHNIMVMPDGTVKVMDFGIAAAGNTGLTEDGSVLGTAHYVSPEQAQGKQLGATSDLYSLGIVLYEAATGKVPFDADSPVAVALKQVNESPVRPTRINPAVDPGLEAIIGRALTKDPRARYQSAEDMRRELLRISRTTANDATTVAAPVGIAASDRTSVMPPVAGGYGDAPAVLPRGASAPEIYEVPEDNSRKTWMWVAIVVALLLAALGIAWASGLFGGGDVTVPSVIGMTMEQATADIEDAGLVVGDIVEQVDATVEPGIVLAQDPEGGASVAEGTEVTLTVAIGAGESEVPDIIGLTEADARQAIIDAGFTPDSQPAEPSEEVPAGEVISQSPEGGEMAPTGSAIAYVVSLGVGTVEVPNVVGLKGTAAKTELEDAGFTVTIEEEFSDSVKSGLVVSQNPKAGLTVGAGSEVVIVVSKGAEPETVLVPDVIDMTESAATDAIKNRGLKVVKEYESGAAAGDPNLVVLEQDPIGGTKVQKGDVVGILLGPAGN